MAMTDDPSGVSSLRLMDVISSRLVGAEFEDAQLALEELRRREVKRNTLRKEASARKKDRF